MDDIRSKIDLIALIAAIGAIVMLAGELMAEGAYPGIIHGAYFVVFVFATVVAILNVRPTGPRYLAVAGVVLGIVSFISAFLIYTAVVEATAATQMSLNVVDGSVWAIFAGALVYTIFCIADLKYNEYKQ